MVPRGFLAGAACAIAMSGSVSPAWAEGACAAKITRSTVVPCAIAASFAVRGERFGVEAAKGRETAASVLLPSNPQLAFSAGARAGDAGARAINWSASISQEIAIAGQRGARVDAARAETDVQAKRAALSERETAALSWVAYFEAIAARDELAVAERLAGLGERLAASVRARADQGLAAHIDADIAYAASMRVIQARAAAERRLATARATLALVVGADPGAPVSVDGDLVPLPVPQEALATLTQKAVAGRGEIGIARAEEVAQERRASMLRRARVPNITLNFTVANDGFNERVLSFGLSFPLPLPSPLGRTQAGEIAEAVALARRASAEAERLAQRVRLEVTTAAHDVASRRAELDAFDPKRVARAEESLKSLSDELSAGRLTARDALLAQQGLVELLQAHLEAKRALCIASVELARASGVALERGAT